jgi:hypothetical protein
MKPTLHRGTISLSGNGFMYVVPRNDPPSNRAANFYDGADVFVSQTHAPLDFDN